MTQRSLLTLVTLAGLSAPLFASNVLAGDHAAFTGHVTVAPTIRSDHANVGVAHSNAHGKEGHIILVDYLPEQ